MKGHTDYQIWKHWLIIFKHNDYVKNDTNAGILHMTDGINQNWTVPNKITPFAAQLCRTPKSITVALHQVPNQFITFNNDGIPRIEDEIVAYTWRRYMDDDSKPWISLLPQTKACKTAMDSIQPFGIGMADDKSLPMVFPVLNYNLSTIKLL